MRVSSPGDGGRGRYAKTQNESPSSSGILLTRVTLYGLSLDKRDVTESYRDLVTLLGSGRRRTVFFPTQVSRISQSRTEVTVRGP